MMDDEEQKVNSQLERFECTICLEVAQEPIVTQCGHLFCWPCFYRWLNQNNEYLVCPNCKNGIRKEQITPLYTRNETDVNQSQRDPSIPKRQQPARQNPQRNRNHLGGMMSSMNLSLGVPLAGYGFFPSLFGLLNQQQNEITDHLEEQVSPEVSKQQYFRNAFTMLVFFCFLFLIICM